MSQLSATSTTVDALPRTVGARESSHAAERTSWRYPADAGTRDLRIDFLRGLAIMFVVVDHIDLFSAFHVISHERIGVVSGAELFVLLSGVVLGMAHRRRAIAEGWRASANRMWARAKLLYLVSLVVVVAAYALSKLPFLDSHVLTTWTDEATGITHTLYGTTPLLLDYPVPPPAVFDILFLNIGPFQFNVMGLYVLLLALAPFGMRLLLAGKWRLLMAISAGLYAANLFLHWRIVPSSFANQFPFLSWQLLFVIGLVVGFGWQRIQRWFSRPLGRIVVLLAWVAFFAFLFFTSNNPAKLDDPWGLRFDVFPVETFWQVYEDWFRRDFLGVLRLVNVMAVVLVFYALLTRLWAPIHRLLGWFFVPLGGATLYVFIMHVVLGLLVASLPFIDHASLMVGTLTHAATLALLWIMVQTKFLFRWVPR